LKKAGLSSLPPYQSKVAPTDDHFYLLFARTATLAHGQSLNNPLLNEIAPKQELWIHPDRATTLGIADGDEVVVLGGGTYVGRIPAKVTKWIHPDAVFMLDRKSTRLNSSHITISYAVFCLKKKNGR